MSIDIIQRPEGEAGDDVPLPGGQTPPIPVGPRIPALRNGVAVLRYLSTKSDPVSAGVIGRHLNLPKSSTYQLLQVLVDEGLIMYLPEVHAYRLGIGIFKLGSAFSRHHSLERLAQPILSKLVGDINVTAHLAILHGHESLYLLSEEPGTPTVTTVEAGFRLPAYLSATGNAMLSLMPSGQLNTIFRSPDHFFSTSDQGPTNVAELKETLAVVREQGWAAIDAVIVDGVTCIAAPITDYLGLPVASCSISIHSNTATRNDWKEIAGYVVNTAHQISKRLRG